MNKWITLQGDDLKRNRGRSLRQTGISLKTCEIHTEDIITILHPKIKQLDLYSTVQFVGTEAEFWERLLQSNTLRSLFVFGISKFPQFHRIVYRSRVSENLVGLRMRDLDPCKKAHTLLFKAVQDGRRMKELAIRLARGVPETHKFWYLYFGAVCSADTAAIYRADIEVSSVSRIGTLLRRSLEKSKSSPIKKFWMFQSGLVCRKGYLDLLVLREKYDELKNWDMDCGVKNYFAKSEWEYLS